MVMPRACSWDVGRAGNKSAQELLDDLQGAVLLSDAVLLRECDFCVQRVFHLARVTKAVLRVWILQFLIQLLALYSEFKIVSVLLVGYCWGSGGDQCTVA